MVQRPDFPDYSIDLYGRGNVEKSCLKLQDDYGLDVNTVLFCYWFGAHHGVIDEDVWRRIEQISGQWQSQVVRPLREARRRLKNPGFEPDQAIAELRESIKQDEITAELTQQRQMQKAGEPAKAANPDNSAKPTNPGNPDEAARHNARALLKRKGIACTAEIEDLFAAISEVAFR